MEFWASVNVLRRRWYVLIPCLLFFAALGALVLVGVKPSYEVSGKILFTQPPLPNNQPNATQNNPVADTPAAFGNLVPSALANNSFKNELIKAGASTDYTIAPPFADNAFIVITINAPTPEAATSSYKTFLRLLEKATTNLQAQSTKDTNTYFRPTAIGPPDGPNKIIGARIKALVVVGVLGLIVSLGLTFLVDSILSARARSAAARRSPTSVEVATSTGPFRLLDHLSDPDYGSEPPTPDESGRAAGT